MDIDQSLLTSSPIKPLVDSLLLGSLPEYPLDILQTDPHPSDLTLALFSAKVYKQEKSVTTAAKSLSDWEMLDEPEGGWRLLTTGSNSAWNNGYFGAAYVNTALQQVVVSHRGTKLSSPGALFTDVYGICWKKYVACTNSAVTFVELIRQVIISVNTQYGRRYNLVITGHSLGGWLAQITAFTVKCLKESGGKLMKNTSGGVHAKAVVFDSPGVKTMLNKLKDDYYYRHTTNILDRLDIRVYVSAPNRINTLGAHLGTIYRVIIDVENFNKLDRKTVYYNKTTHGIDNFVTAFRNNLDIHKVLDWAKNTNEFVLLFGKDALNHSNNYHRVIEKEKIELPLRKKIKRYHTASSGQSSTLWSGIILECDSKIFSDNELHVLNQLRSIQKHQNTNNVLNKFVSDKKLKFEEGKLLFPDFEIDHANQTITCKPNHLIIEFANRLKQVMRWFETDFTEIVRKQVEDLPLAFDSVYRAVGQSFLDSITKSSLNFKDSLHLQDFLLSDTARVLSVVTKDGEFEIIRLLNVFSQIRDSIDSSHPIIKYTNESHYTVVDWPRLQTLFKIGGSPIYQNNLMIVDGTSSSTECPDLRTFFNNNYTQCSPINLKKLVFISSHAIDVFNSFENINVQTFFTEHQINLHDLSDESQKSVLSRNLMSMGKKLLSFRDLLEERCSISNINEFLSSDQFWKIAINEEHEYTIKDTRPLMCDLQMPYITTNITTSKEFILNCTTNSLVVISGLNRGDLETGAAWEQFEGKILLAEGDAELFFKDTCNKNQDKTIYLFEVSGDAGADVRCTHIFNSSFYVTRKFKHRITINLQYFMKGMLADDMFVICSEEQKTSLLGMIEESTNKKALEKVLLVATKEKEVDIIQKNSDKNIHFVRLAERDKLNKSDENDTFEASDEGDDSDTFESSDESDERDALEASDERGVLEWRYSHGSVKSLRPHVSTDSFKPLDERTLSQTDRRLVIITDEPGMGKTTSLASLSRLIEAAWVIHIEVKQFKAHIDRLPDQLNSQNVARFILSECCTGADGDLAHGLLDNLLQSKTGSRRVVIMFDGFDEMDDYTKGKESSKDKLIKVFAFLQSKPTIQIFLTSRKYLKDSLESELSQFSTSFVMITLQEQQDFLFKFWRSFLPIELGINPEGFEKRLEEYAAEVLRRAKLVLGPDTDCFMGIPLQLRMLAEVFRPKSDLLSQSLKDLFEKIDIVSSPNLYKTFISQKFIIYLHNKTLIGNALDEDDLNEKYLEPLTKDHGELGFKTFFSDFYNYLISNNYLKDLTDQKLVKLSRVGLIQSLGNGEFRFIHRTYAEYFCAKMVVQWIILPDITFKYQLIKNVLLPQILLHPDSKVIRLFINVELYEKPILNIQHIISQLWLEDSAVFRGHDHQTALHIAIKEHNEHIVAFLVSELSPLKENSPEDYVTFFIQQDMMCLTPLDLEYAPNSLNIESNSALNRIVTNIIKSIEKCSHETQEMFFFGYLFKSRETLLSNYFRVRESSNFSRASERLKEVYLLIEPFMKAVSDNNVKVVNEILSERLHNNIERYRVLLLFCDNNKYDDDDKDGADDEYYEDHKDDEYYENDQDDEYYESDQDDEYYENDQDDEYYESDQDNEYYENDQDDEYYKNDQDDEYHNNDHDDQTALHLAAKRGHLDVVRLLAKHTSPRLFNLLMARLTSYGRIPLLIAAWYGHLGIVKFFKERGADINICSEQGITALMLAARNEHLPTVEFLVENGSDIKSTDYDGDTVLHHALRGCNLSVIEYLVNKGGDLKSTNDRGETLLHRAAWRGYLPIVKYLLPLGANLNRLDKNFCTPLTLASRERNWDVMQVLIDEGADVNADGGEALRWAIQWGEWSIVKSLVDKQASVKESVIKVNLSKFKNKFPNYEFRRE